MQITANTHNVIMENRKKAVMTGVKDVESYNDAEMIIITHSGSLKLKGKGLELVKISTETGELEITGEITSLHYSDADRTPNNFITKLFR